MRCGWMITLEWLSNHQVALNNCLFQSRNCHVIATSRWSLWPNQTDCRVTKGTCIFSLSPNLNEFIFAFVYSTFFQSVVSRLACPNMQNNSLKCQQPSLLPSANLVDSPTVRSTVALNGPNKQSDESRNYINRNHKSIKLNCSNCLLYSSIECEQCVRRLNGDRTNDSALICSR